MRGTVHEPALLAGMCTTAARTKGLPAKAQQSFVVAEATIGEALVRRLAPGCIAVPNAAHFVLEGAELLLLGYERNDLGSEYRTFCRL